MQGDPDRDRMLPESLDLQSSRSRKLGEIQIAVDIKLAGSEGGITAGSAEMAPVRSSSPVTRIDDSGARGLFHRRTEELRWAGIFSMGCCTGRRGAGFKGGALEAPCGGCFSSDQVKKSRRIDKCRVCNALRTQLALL